MINYWRKENAVKVTHIPTGIEIIVDFTRSQHKNKAMALKILKGKLWALKHCYKEEEIVATYDIGEEYKDELYEYRESKIKIYNVD